jgi:predicted  nucleic acid-binding Zn-ribbon protein
VNKAGAPSRRGTARTSSASSIRSSVAPERDAARAREVEALVRLAELDSALVAQEEHGRKIDAGSAAERHRLAGRLSPEIREAYDRALRAGRQPAVVCLVKSVCTGCHVRLHALLDQKVQRRRGVAACPHCLRLVYDPAWLKT